MSTDLIVFGATSFVGRIACRHLVDRLADTGVTWAMAGRNAAGLEEVAEEAGADVPRIVADATDPDDMAALVEQGSVVISTVGPYALYGSALVAAVAEAGVAYCDLTGEPQWMRRMIDAHHDRAVETGARIVHTCGFDSIPSDLGVHFLEGAAQERFGEPCTDVRLGVKAAKGGFSGGTIASLLNVMEEASVDPSLRELLDDPYALCPYDDLVGVEQPEVRWPTRDSGFESWQAPFVMAMINTKVVHRSHALLGRPYGPEFTYGESMLTGDGWAGRAAATAVASSSAAITGAMSVGPVRRALAKVLPEPGEGPSPAKQEAGFFDIRLRGETEGGDELMVKVTGDRDPGYGSTAKMLVESALVLLATEGEREGGVLTPATALGDDGITALVDHAGLTFDVL